MTAPTQPMNGIEFSLDDKRRAFNQLFEEVRISYLRKEIEERVFQRLALKNIQARSVLANIQSQRRTLKDNLEIMKSIEDDYKKEG